MRTYLLSLSCACVALTALSSAASAQTGGDKAKGDTAQTDPADQTQLQEIVVTASKRREALSRAPLAVSAISQAGLDKGGTTQIQELVQQMPNLKPSINGFSIRGVGSSNNTEAGTSTVALHIDGVYEQRPQIMGFPLFDIERVEVLRGPQGTLYGRNATAGVVNIITATPKDKFEAFGDVAYGNYDETIVRAAMNVPVTSTLAVRASGVYRSNDGYFNTAGSTPENYDKADQLAGRFTVRWAPSSKLTWQGSLSYAQEKGTVPAAVLRATGSYTDSNIYDATLGTPNPVIMTGNDPRNGSNSTLYNANNRLNYYELALRSTLDYAFTDTLSLSWVAGHSLFRDTGRQLNQNPSVFLANNKAIADSQELDLKYNTDRLHGVLGLYYYSEIQRNAAVINGVGSFVYPYSTLLGATGTAPVIAASLSVASNTPRRSSQSKAVFGQLTYSLTDRLRLTGGLRYNDDRQTSDAQYFGLCVYGTASAPTFQVPGCTAVISPQVNIGGLSTGSTNLSWKASADFDLTSDILAYATVDTGYHGGGAVGKNVPQQYWTFAPETVTNYEAGLRSLWFNRRLSLNLTGFHMDYKNLQVTSLVQSTGGNPLPVTTNAARARINGLEFEGAWQLTPADRISGFATWLDAKFVQFTNATEPFYTPDSGYNTVRTVFGLPTLATPSFDFSGHHLANSPEWNLKGSYAHTFKFSSGGVLTFTGSVNWQTQAYLTATNYAGDRIPAYTRTDLDLLWESPGKHFTADLFVNNLENRSIPNAYGAYWGAAFVTYARPRLYGARLGYRF